MPLKRPTRTRQAAKQQLDFFVIGAAKSATTTLYQLLAGHPEITIPAGKEVPYFSDNSVYVKGIRHYLGTYFGDADPTTSWGTVTPHYMLGQGEVTPRMVAYRMAAELPDVRLIALLRDPMERAFSHYKMSVQRGYEHRSFDDVVTETLADVPRARLEVDPKDDYIFGSEYGRILAPYYALFPATNILVLTTEELRDDAIGTLQRMCAFLGVNTSFRPAAEDLEKRHRQGGTQPRLRFLTPGAIYSLPYVEKIWKQYVPFALRRKVEYRMNLWNSRPDSVALDRGSAAYAKLRDYYRDDIARSEELTGLALPWGAGGARRPQQAATGGQAG